MSKDRTVKDDSTREQTFTAYIIKGNRQVIRREVTASKRFVVDNSIYLIKENCIFLKNIEGKLHSVSFYRENNPNPYNFEKINEGITAKELDEIYSEDFYHIITDLTPNDRMVYILLLSIVDFAVLLAFIVGGAMHIFF